MLTDALKPLNIPLIGAVSRNPALERPSRHLGLHQAFEHTQIDSFILNTAEHLKQHLDLDLLENIARTSTRHCTADSTGLQTVPPLGKRIAIAKDPAFSFIYPHFITSWCKSGCEIQYFSPLNDEFPDTSCDAIYLPGGYPELHLSALETAQKFKSAVVRAARSGKVIYAECGGHMVLGKSIIGDDEKEFAMTGLLPHRTSFSSPRMVLGYRQLSLASKSSLGIAGTVYRGHEFHYSREIEDARVTPLFEMENAEGLSLGSGGFCINNINSSFLHLIDIA
jgi:cobyrinic acid a,c-diamide synthase